MKAFLAELAALEAGETPTLTTSRPLALNGLLETVMAEVAKHFPDGDAADHLAAMLSNDPGELHISLVARTAKGRAVLEALAGG